MTIELRWLLPITTPFVMALLFRLLTLVTGVSYDPSLAFAVSGVFGPLLGLCITVVLGEEKRRKTKRGET